MSGGMSINYSAFSGLHFNSVVCDSILTFSKWEIIPSFEGVEVDTGYVDFTVRVSIGDGRYSSVEVIMTIEE